MATSFYLQIMQGSWRKHVSVLGCHGLLGCGGDGKVYKVHPAKSHTWILLLRSEIWAPKNPPKTDRFGTGNLTSFKGLGLLSFNIPSLTGTSWRVLGVLGLVLGLVVDDLANVFVPRPMRQLYWVCEAEAGQDGEMEEELWPPGPTN